MEGIARGLERAHPGFNAGWRVTVLALDEELLGEVRPALLVLLAGTAILLLMSCTNVAGLLLARAGGRQREVAVRAALGAPRSRIVRQLLTDSLLLAAAGGTAGLALALWVTRLLVALSPAEIPRLRQVGLNAGVLLFTLAVSMAAGVLFGIVPALHLSGGDLHAALREGGRGQGAGPGRRRTQRVLVVAEIALATVLLIAAGLTLRSFVRLRGVHPGLDPANLLTMKVPLAGGRHDTPRLRVAFFQEALRRVEAIPGVISAGAVSLLPLDGFGAGVTFSIQGQPVPAAGEKPAALARVAAGNYFRAMRIPLLEGRWLGQWDGAEAPRVVLVNETLARRFPGGRRAALGERVVLDFQPPVSAEIVGVVGDVKPDRLRSQTWPTIYGPHAQMTAPNLSLAARTAGNALHMAPAVTAAIASLDRDQPVAEVRTMERIVSQSMAAERFYAVLLGIFAAVAVALASVGVYGVLAYQVTERAHELGVRLALGATRGRVLALVLGEGALLALCGIGVGVAAALPLVRLLPAFLFGVAADPAIFAATALLLAAVALLAAWLPARRAARLDPAASLRHE
jgi:putative ABC transport system permease protein